MAASYPGAIKTFSSVVNGVTKLVAALFNSPYDEVTAVETELGTDVAGSATDLKTRLAVSLNDDGTLNPPLGTWVDKSASYGAQQATTDGFVVAYLTPSQNYGALTGYTDVNIDPTTIRAVIDSIAQGFYGSIMFPVKKSDYWKIVAANVTTIAVYWIPLGSA